MSTFLLEIVTPVQVAFTSLVEMVTVPSADGTLGILPRHISLFSQLVEGELKIKTGKDELYLAIGGGFIEVTKEKVMILVTRAVNALQLNEQEIVEAKQRAEIALKNKPSGASLVSVQTLLQQSITDLKILRRRKLHH